MVPQIRLIQIMLTAAAGFLGVSSGILMGRVSRYFHKQCILNANVSVSWEGPHNLVRVLQTSEWGDPQICDFVTFEGIFVTMTSIIWIWFFIHAEHINGEEQTALFVLPLLLCNSILFVTSFTRGIYVSNGWWNFFNSICVNNEESCKNVHAVTNQLQFELWEMSVAKRQRHEIAYPFVDVMHATVLLALLQPLTLGAHVVVVLADVFVKTTKPVHERRAYTMVSAASSRSPTVSVAASHMTLHSLPSTEKMASTWGSLEDSSYGLSNYRTHGNSRTPPLSRSCHNPSSNRAVTLSSGGRLNHTPSCLKRRTLNPNSSLSRIMSDNLHVNPRSMLPASAHGLNSLPIFPRVQHKVVKIKSKGKVQDTPSESDSVDEIVNVPEKTTFSEEASNISLDSPTLYSSQ